MPSGAHSKNLQQRLAQDRVPEGPVADDRDHPRDSPLGIEKGGPKATLGPQFYQNGGRRKLAADISGEEEGLAFENRGPGGSIEREFVIVLQNAVGAEGQGADGPAVREIFSDEGAAGVGGEGELTGQGGKEFISHMGGEPFDDSPQSEIVAAQPSDLAFGKEIKESSGEEDKEPPLDGLQTGQGRRIEDEEAEDPVGKEDPCPAEYNVSDGYLQSGDFRAGPVEAMGLAFSLLSRHRIFCPSSTRLQGETV